MITASKPTAFTPRNVRFFKKIVLFVSPFALWLIIEFGILPIQFFAFRVWESVQVMQPNAVLPGPFYPNQHISMIESGKITRYTRFAVKQPVEWYTDRYGYRNRDTSAKASIVLIGDSFLVGTLLTQNQIPSEVLTNLTGQYTYNFGPCFEADKHMEYFLADQRFEQHRPKW